MLPAPNVVPRHDEPRPVRKRLRRHIPSRQKRRPKKPAAHPNFFIVSRRQHRKPMPWRGHVLTTTPSTR